MRHSCPAYFTVLRGQHVDYDNTIICIVFICNCYINHVSVMSLRISKPTEEMMLVDLHKYCKNTMVLSSAQIKSRNVFCNLRRVKQETESYGPRSYRLDLYSRQSNIIESGNDVFLLLVHNLHLTNIWKQQISDTTRHS